LVLDGHGSHVTLKAIKQAKEFGLDMVTLPSHTSHAQERKRCNPWLQTIILNQKKLLWQHG
jgi:hypothetical protein